MKTYKKNKKILKQLTIMLSVLSLLFGIAPAYSDTAPESFQMELKSDAQTAIAQEKVPAFDGAEGGGMWATGARGAENPEVYHVTNLNDSGEGSFRDAVSKGNRFVVFDVGGNIKLKTPVYAKNVSNLTILGQTAPGEGISIEGDQVGFRLCSNIIMRYLRIRMASETTEGDTLSFIDCDNIIVDHCSLTWSVDECVDIYGVKDATIQWCIVSEGLNNTIHSKGAHGMGTLWGGINMTAHHNLLSSNRTRNPAIATGSGVETYRNAPDTDSVVNIRNNVIYNWGGSSYGGQNGTRLNFVGNYYKPGPGTNNTVKKVMFDISGTPVSSLSLPENGGTLGGGKGIVGWGASMYAKDNYIEDADEVNKDNWKGIRIDSSVGTWDGAYIKCEDISDGIYVDGVLRRNDEYLDEYPVITQKAQSTYSEVLKYVGASDKRDPIDERIVNDVINGTAPTGSISGLGFIDSPDDVGGFITLDGGTKLPDADNDGLPDEWEDKNGLDKNDPTDSVKINSDGYTMLEAYGEELITGENKPADKSELKENIYSAFNLNKYDYSIKSWDNMQMVLSDAKEAVSIVYPDQTDIDAACENLKNAVAALEPETKRGLRIEIENAKKLNSQEYLNYDVLKGAITSAETIYNNSDSAQSDIDGAVKTLKDAVKNLEFDYRYLLNQLIEKADKEDQVAYTIESMTNLIEKNKAAKDLVGNANASNDELKVKYEDLKAARNSLENESDVYSRFTGDFENLLCYKINGGHYGKFNVNVENAACEVKQNVGDNKSKALVISNNPYRSTSLAQCLSKKLEGNVRFEGDYYFETAPEDGYMLLRLSDSDLTYKGWNSSDAPGLFLRLNTKKVNSNICLEVDNSGNLTTVSDVTFKQGKWYNIKADVDTVKRDYVVYIDNREVHTGHIAAAVAEKKGFGVISYQLGFGGRTQTLVFDNLGVSVLGDKEKLKALIGAAKTLNSAMYTEESFEAVQESLAAAEKVYNSTSVIQGDDMQIAMDSLQNSIDGLVRNGIGYELSELINASEDINQMEYTFESTENLALASASAREKLADTNSSDEDLRSEYEKLNAAFSALVAGVDNSKISGDFEKLSCIGLGGKLGDERYGRYRIKFLDNTCRIKENIGGNPTKALWMNSLSSLNRGIFEYNFTEKYYNKISGVISVEGDYYFETEPSDYIILLRLIDNNFDGKVTNILTLTPLKVNAGRCLRVNYMDKEINNASNIMFETGRWYNIKVILDTVKKEYSVYVDGNEIITAPAAEIPSGVELGLSRYNIATSRNNVMAIDNVKSEFVGDMDRLKSGVDEAKRLNPQIYTKESYEKLKNIAEFAEEVCNGSRSLQAGELRSLCETLSAAFDELKNFEESTPEPAITPEPEQTATPVPSETPKPTDKPLLPPDGYEYPYRIIDCKPENNTITITAEKYCEIGDGRMIFAEYDSEGRLCAVKIEDVYAAEESVLKKSFPYESRQFCVFIWGLDMLTPYSEKYSIQQNE